MVALEKFGAKTAFEMGVVCTPFQFGIARSEKVNVHFALSHLVNTVKLLWVSP